MMSGESDRLALEESARFIGSDLSPHTLRAWAKQGRIPYVKIGRRIFFEKSDLRAFVQRARVERRGKGVA
jgi:excisionase family DNA binding protein